MQRSIVNDGRPVFGAFEHGAKEILRFMEPGLIVDCGAAAGYVTKWMLHFSPQSRAKCFEPFPGNWRFIEDVLGSDPRVEIHRKAVGARVGTVPFEVSGVVPDGQRFEGYSSLGKIVDKPTDKTINVPVTTLDAEISEPIRFLKIDVQDGELDVLRGATETLQRGVDVAYIEYGGEPDLLDFLLERFLVFSDKCHIRPYVENADLSGWTDLEPMKLSTGHDAFYAWPAEHITDPSAYSEMFRSERRKGITVYTDLVCFDPAKVEAILSAASGNRP